MRPIAVIGSLWRDVVAGARPRPGGAPFYAGRALRLLACPTTIYTRCAEEHRAELLPPLVALGHRVEWRPATSTASFSFRYDGDVRSMRVDALGDPWTEDDVRTWIAPALGKTEWLHVGVLTSAEFPPATLAALGRGRRISFDGQGLVRRPRVGPLELRGDADATALHHVDVLKLAEEEAVALLGGFHEEDVGRLGVPEVIVTRGSRGALLWAEGRLTHVPVRALPPSHVDPTGAGDAFAAAYVASRAAGAPPQAAARRATGVVVALLSGRTR